MAKRPKRANLRPAGKCIFCGGGGLSKAHIFPAWLHLYNKERTDKHIQEVGTFETFTPRSRTPAPRRTIHQGDAGTKKVRKVCIKCNSGWLGDIETPAKPLVLWLMRQKHKTITPSMQRILARWFCAITMLLDAAVGAETSAVPQADRDHFRLHKDPPDHWRIWIARYVGENWQLHRVRHVGLKVLKRSELSEPERCNTQVTTLVIRRLCAHIFSSTAFSLPGYEGIALQQLWPPSDTSHPWALAPNVTDEGVVVLAEAFARDLQPIG
jgi:hypothetical protein